MNEEPLCSRLMRDCDESRRGGRFAGVLLGTVDVVDDYLKISHRRVIGGHDPDGCKSWIVSEADSESGVPQRLRPGAGK